MSVDSISGGTEIITCAFLHLLETMLRDSPFRSANTCPKAAAKLDFVNMFNQVSRKATYEQLETVFPDLCYLFQQLYPAQGNPVWAVLTDGTWYHFLEKEGFAQ